MSYQSFTSNYRSPLTDLGNMVGNAEKSTAGMFNSFRNNRLVSGTNDFLQSNSLVAKVSFLILVVILFTFLLTLSSRFLAYVFSPTGDPYLFDGMKNAKKLLHIPQDPKKKDAIPILRSANKRDGIEFTYSTWIYIDDLEYKTGQKKHIFHKGSSNMNRPGKFEDINTLGLAFPNNAPGLYLHETKNTLIVIMNTYDQVLEEVEIPNIPLNKWLHVVIRVKHRVMDVYINGSIAVRHKFSSVPKQNYGDVYVNMNGGFSGNMSSLRYFNHALSGVEILDLNRSGPNLKANDSMEVFPPYFSLRWYFQN
jgi:hypothetical protein